MFDLIWDLEFLCEACLLMFEVRLYNIQFLSMIKILWIVYLFVNPKFIFILFEIYSCYVCKDIEK